jgi:hypothetical protein
MGQKKDPTEIAYGFAPDPKLVAQIFWEPFFSLICVKMDAD